MSKLSESRQRKWLRGELPGLVASGVLTADSAAALQRHYAEEESGRGFGFVLLAATGSALIGAGIILLVARNWDELNRAIRSGIAFLPLLASLVLGLFALQRRNDSGAWREGASLFNIAAFATALALISQAWQIQGSLSDFLAVCLIVALPVVYLFRANFGALVYILGCGVWIVNRTGWRSDLHGRMAFWIFLAAMIPFYVQVCRRGRRGWTFGSLTTALVIVCVVAMFCTDEYGRLQFASIGFAGLFTLFYLCGIVAIRDFESPLNALTILGAIGIAVTAIVLSFSDVWPKSGASWTSLANEEKLAAVLCVFFPVAAIALAVWLMLRRQIEYSIAAAALPLVAFVGRYMTTESSNDRYGAALLLNVYTVVLGAELMVRGIKAGSVTRANFGLLIIVVLACTRFFDSDLTFVARGVGFICVGAAFLVTNILFFRRRPAA